ncbi:hypothetical protein HZC53_03810 [Candidatus Uhrbacteria bacterium]|nr:hypothetical protein [Candidatus Uhrbacteria bacterium]
MQKLITYLKVAAISGTVVLLSVPFAMEAAMPQPAGSVYNQAAYNYYQPGETVSEGSAFVAMPLKGVRIKDLQGADQGSLRISQVMSFPQDRNWLVFMVTIEPAFSSPDMPTTYKVFRYNLSTNQLQRIYRFTTEKSFETSYSLVGFDGVKLVVSSTGYDNSPGPCFNAWSKDSGIAYKYLDMRSPWKGLKEYQVPAALTKQGERESKLCQLEMEIGDIKQYCTGNVKAVASCGMYVQTVSSLPTGNMSFTFVEDKTVTNCPMNPASQSQDCKNILKVCTPLVECSQ